MPSLARTIKSRRSSGPATRSRPRSAVLLTTMFALLGLSIPALAGTPSDSRYIVVLKDAGRAGDVAREHSARLGAQVERVYEHALKGYSANLDSQEAAQIRRDPRVAFVEPDALSTMSLTQSNPTWGLDRIDQRDLPLSGSYTWDADGTGVTAFVMAIVFLRQ